MPATPKTTCLAITFISGLSPLLLNGELRRANVGAACQNGYLCGPTQQDLEVVSHGYMARSGQGKRDEAQMSCWAFCGLAHPAIHSRGELCRKKLVHNRGPGK